MTVRNEIKAQIVRAGYTMQELVDRLHEEYGWSDSVSNLSAKLQRESIRYKEVVELADVLGYDLIWQKRRYNRSSCSFSMGVASQVSRLEVSSLKTRKPTSSCVAISFFALITSGDSSHSA